jgi:phospholipid-translocating ATPase
VASNLISVQIPGLSTTGSFTTILPLLFFVFVTIAKEGYDDYRRHRLDVVENASFATIVGREDHYTGKVRAPHPLQRWNPFHIKIATETPALPDDEYNGLRWVPVRWGNIKVGDIIRLSRDDPVPADLVLLHSDGEEGLAYVETMALDGETNLKSKRVIHDLEGCDTIGNIARRNAEFVVEDPNAELYNFDGRVNIDGKSVPVTLNEIIYRGSILRNTNCAIGVVINTGEECKIRMNSNRHPKAKKPALERIVNRIVVALATYVVIQSVGVSMGYVKWQKDYERHAWYLDGAGVPFHRIIIAFIIMFNNVVPLALYISLEIVKVGQLLMLNSDIEMYDEETDTPARCNTNTILENLGQVGYIFSDKTGTLTDNVMKFRKISVAGTVWLHQTDLEQSGMNAAGAKPAEVEDTLSADGSLHKPEPTNIVIQEDLAEPMEVPLSPTSPTAGRRSSSAWRSAARPDHLQPEFDTTDLAEYLRLRPDSPFARMSRDYVLAMALCHTCLPEVRDGKLEYQASSPDELALVRAASELGYSVVQRNTQSITIQATKPNGSIELLKFDILDIVEFSSSRKRMSVVVRYPDGRISVICKGADTTILPRLKLSSLATQKANEVRQSIEVERELHRRSEQQEPRNSFGGRPSLTMRRNPSFARSRSPGRRPTNTRSQSFEINQLMRRSTDRTRQGMLSRGMSFEVSRAQFGGGSTLYAEPLPPHLSFLEDPSLLSESEVFSKCFKHLDDFATEGLRTLLYAQRFLTHQEYSAWKKIYNEATTSIVNRQELVESAGEMIEQSFDLIGASAIEDKLQEGVPETIDRLRRANIKIWMLTGDKRETAINIAHSATLCRPTSDLFTLDVEKGSLEAQLTTLAEELQTGSQHSVVVIDGQTLGVVEKAEVLAKKFYDVMLLVDSVICCRASPSQKALLVTTVRSQLRSYKGKDCRGVTLAIGDGANDIAMIQASHVGVGISGKEGLQAARVADYSIAQFRFLQRLLLVHGRWNYVRTAKFILCTFWKEMFFYMSTAVYQRYTGYSGTSLYEATSLTVFNTLFTSLCCICMGIWEQDLRAETLLAVPELYIYGQRNMGLNFWKFLRWMFLGASEGLIVWFAVWGGYGWTVPGARDQGVYALGTLAFTTCVLWINWKLFIFETHFKSSIVMTSFFVTTTGWFAWLAFLDGVYAAQPVSKYNISNSFTQLWGKDALWWATLFIVLGILGLIEIVMKAVKRKMILVGAYKWPPWQKAREGNNAEEWGLELWQELEQDPVLWEKLKRMSRGGEDEAEDVDFADDLDDRGKASGSITRGGKESLRSAFIRRLRSFWR